jgi:23S rRNA (adenine2030-N6)-methyltransferase
MNYRHAYHAGNFADVVKHLALVAVLQHLQKKDTPVAVIDTHAGRGLYDLEGNEAKRTGEAGAGIAKLRKVKGEGALATYLDIAAGWGNDRYPGSPLFAARLLRSQDRLVAIEKHPDEEALLKHALQPFGKARANLGNGYERLRALLPPPERRGIVLIDPPYESDTDFADAAGAVAATMKRFANAVVLIWFPIKSKAEANAFCGEILTAGVGKALRIDIAIAAPPKSDKERLTSAGLVVVNPPYGFDGEMERALQTIAGPLDARGSVAWLTEA